MEYETKMSGAGNPPPYSSETLGPAPGYPPPQPQPQMMVVTQPAMVHAGVVPMVLGPQVGSQPSAFVCKSCNTNIVTRVEMKSTTKTHLFAFLFCIIGCWPCVCIPYCVDSCKNADHYCPNCNAYIGSYSN